MRKLPISQKRGIILTIDNGDEIVPRLLCRYLELRSKRSRETAQTLVTVREFIFEGAR